MSMRSGLTQGAGKRKQSEGNPGNNLRLNFQVSNRSQLDASPHNRAPSVRSGSHSPATSKTTGATALTIANLEKRQRAYNKTQQLTKLVKTINTNSLSQKACTDLKESML